MIIEWKKTSSCMKEIPRKPVRVSWIPMKTWILHCEKCVSNVVKEFHDFMKCFRQGFKRIRETLRDISSKIWTIHRISTEFIHCISLISMRFLFLKFNSSQQPIKSSNQSEHVSKIQESSRTFTQYADFTWSRFNVKYA